MATLSSVLSDPKNIFPTPFEHAFTTSPPFASPPHPEHPKCQIAHFDLSAGDKPLGVRKVASGMTHSVVSAPCAGEDVLAWEAVYPKGSVNPGNKTAPKGGFGFYLSGPDNFTFENAKEVVFSYAIHFEEGFEFR